MFVDFQLSAMKIKVIDYLNLIQNWVFQFSIADFYLFKTGLSNNVKLISVVVSTTGKQSMKNYCSLLFSSVLFE